ncbi:28158_t:CDS:2 [Dentiscutata erythropus]|uniref:28158_t:CDS:1 n=1 Tax=Dentiscutata erythropus TaxID=1348616 RepID=A0A9N8ZFM0_9GLOM|nr:28158_t:CDS:2 [Dentiscutata erythropus]
MPNISHFSFNSQGLNFNTNIEDSQENAITEPFKTVNQTDESSSSLAQISNVNTETSYVQCNTLSTLEIMQLIEKYKSKRKTPSSFLIYKNKHKLNPSEAKMKYEHETDDVRETYKRLAEMMRSGSTSNFINLAATSFESSVQNTSINLHQPITQKERVPDFNNIFDETASLQQTFQLSHLSCPSSKSIQAHLTNNTLYPMSAIVQGEYCNELNSISSYQALISPTINPLDICNKNGLITSNGILNDKHHMSNWSEFQTSSNAYVQGINQFENDVLFNHNNTAPCIDEESLLFGQSQMEMTQIIEQPSFFPSEESMFYDNNLRYYFY